MGGLRLSDNRRPGEARRGAPARGASAAKQTPAAPSARRAAGGAVRSGARRSGDRVPGDFWLLAAIGAGILLLGFILQRAMPEGFPLARHATGEQPVRYAVTEIHSAGPLRLNEVMSANGGALADENGVAPDWIEIANIGSRTVDLENFVLAHDAKKGNVFVFPKMALGPGECAVVFADGTLRAEPGQALHAPFKLSSGGDVLMLFNASSVAIDTVNIPALAENEAYARTSATGWAVTADSTPGRLNDAGATLVESPVHIVEIVASSEHLAPDENGVCRDYVILENSSGADADIGGWYLSDSARLPCQWRVPNGTVVPAGGRLLVYCSGLNRADDPAHLHAGFRLASEGEQAVLANAAGQPVDVVEYDLLATDAAYVRASDGSWSVGKPTAERVG